MQCTNMQQISSIFSPNCQKNHYCYTTSYTEAHIKLTMHKNSYYEVNLTHKSQRICNLASSSRARWSAGMSTNCPHHPRFSGSLHAKLSPWLSGWRSASRVCIQVWRTWMTSAMASVLGEPTFVCMYGSEHVLQVACPCNMPEEK